MADKKMICPLMGKECIEDGAVVGTELHACRFWIHVTGKHPQTGVDQDLWDCSFAWMPVLLIENSNRQRETAAEVEKLRNETVPQNNAMNGIMAKLLSNVTPPALGNEAKWIGDES
jgi:hypothetical protein